MAESRTSTRVHWSAPFSTRAPSPRPGCSGRVGSSLLSFRRPFGHLVEVALERVDVRAPEAAERREPTRRPRGRLRADPVDPPLRLDPRLDEPRVPQHPQVLRHRGLRQVQALLELARPSAPTTRAARGWPAGSARPGSKKVIPRADMYRPPCICLSRHLRASVKGRVLQLERPRPAAAASAESPCSARSVVDSRNASPASAKLSLLSCRKSEEGPRPQRRKDLALRLWLDQLLDSIQSLPFERRGVRSRP